MIITKNLTIDWLIDWIIYLLLANVKWEDFQIYLWREYSCSKESVITMGGPRAESWMYREKIYNGYWKCCLAKGNQRPKWCSLEHFACFLLRSRSMTFPRHDAFIYIVPQVFHMFRTTNIVRPILCESWYFTHAWKHLHDFIISLSEEVWSIKLAVPLFYWSVLMCVRGIDFAYFYDFSVPTDLWLFFLHFTTHSNSK